MRLNDKTISEIEESCLLKGHLGEALMRLAEFFRVNNLTSYQQELDDIRKDYTLMMDYAAQGMDDPGREPLYRRLTASTFRLIYNYYLRQVLCLRNTYAQALKKTAGWEMSIDEVQHRLEDYVSEQAMLALDPASAKTARTAAMFQNHQSLLEQLFDRILVEPMWSDSHAQKYEQLILSPTIDIKDACLIVSAITLAASNLYDYFKLRTLVNVYCAATDEHLKQRALVGMAFSIDFDHYRKEQKELFMKTFSGNEEFLSQLLELQKQIFFCLNTDKDSKEIQKDIMPDLIKNGNIEIGRFGIREKEEDPMDDILHPEADDEKAEKLEKSMHRMMDMQKQGSDIYFGGFSQMKGYAFFFHLANWFVPFYKEHPGISRQVENIQLGRLMQKVIEEGPFCDSDKYSFVLSIANVINRMPENIRKLLSSGEAQMGMPFDESALTTPTYIRRMYLQDLYRFFRLYNDRNDFRNPFEKMESTESLGSDFLITSTVLEKLDGIKPRIAEFVRFLIAHDAVEKVDASMEFVADDDKDLLLMLGKAQLKKNKTDNAEWCLTKAFELDPNDDIVAHYLGKALLLRNEFDKAATIYSKLVERHPDNSTYLLNYSVAMVETGHAAEVTEHLYRLNYERPESAYIQRVLAWGLFCAGKPEQAEKYYRKLIDDGKSLLGDDFLNLGYCLWVQHKAKEAVEVLRAIGRKRDELSRLTVLQRKCFDDRQVLHAVYHLSNFDINLICEAAIH